MKPPHEIDGAEVVLWAWSAPEPFFRMPCGEASIPIHGLAICRYADSGSVYRFSCNSDWETRNDSPHPSVESATKGESGQYDIASVEWHRLDA